jgi:hypothetical protein
MSDQPATLALLGKQHVTRLPSFGVREALVVSAARLAEDDGDDVRFLWVLAAIVGACSGIGALAGGSFARDGYDVLRYGERVYSYLREQGASGADIGKAGAALLEPMSRTLMPGEEEVKAAEGF